MPKIKCTCFFCGAEVYKYPADIKRTRLSFCSPDCHYAYARSKRPVVVCIQCGTAINRCPSAINSNEFNFCSNACYGAYTKSLRPPLTCAHCGAAISRTPSQVKNPLANFCSRACRNAHRRVGHITPKGYRRIRVNGKYAAEHRHVMEQHLGRKLSRSEDVHHENRHRADNSLSNLVVKEHSVHTREHNPLSFDIETAKAMRAEGLSFNKISKALGVVHSTVISAFIRRGLHVPKAKHV
jgi:hypothetical protein